MKNMKHRIPKLISAPARITAAGNKPKVIEEFIGRVNSGESRLSIARMQSPGGWVEPGQSPEFDEFTIVLKRTLRLTHKDGVLDVNAGQAVITHAGEWVQYSTPDGDGAEYITVLFTCIFAADGASRRGVVLVVSNRRR
jgi:hypothetical protein